MSTFSFKLQNLPGKASVSFAGLPPHSQRLAPALSLMCVFLFLVKARVPDALKGQNSKRQSLE